MVIKLCMDLLYAVVSLIFQGIQVLHLPPEVYSVMQAVWEYLEEGAAVVAAYTHYQYLLLLLSFVITVSAAMNGYRLIMWILRKIPYWGVD